MTKLKVTSIALMSTVLLIGVFIFTSCAPAAAPPAPAPAPPKSERMPPAVAVIPNVTRPGVKVNYVGANFEPGEKVIITILAAPGAEYTLYRPKTPEEGLSLEVNELGSFKVNNKIPAQLTPGAYPVRVYNEEGEMLASTVLKVEE